MKHLLVRHKVADFAKWKRAFTTHAAARKSAGLKELHVLRSFDDPNDVVMLFAAASVSKAKALISSVDMRVVMQKAGVKGKPEFTFLK